jgi:hypothetical protein
MEPLDFFRIDKNIAHNIDFISKSHNDESLVNSDGGLIKNLIYFFCYSYQNNLFNFGSFTVYDFASKFGYSEDYLKGRHVEPYQLKNKSKTEILALYKKQSEDINFKIYDSVIENALYILHTRPIVFVRGAKTVDYQNNEKIYTSESNSYIIINQLVVNKISKLTKANGGQRKLRGNAGDKYVFNYALDKLFIENLSHYYLKGVRESLLQLRKSSLDDLYLYLLNLRSNLYVKNQHQTTLEEYPNFELLCSLTNIKKVKSDGNKYDDRYRKRDLVKCFKEINKKTELKFEYQWTKKSADRQYFVPIIVFEEQEKTNEPFKERDNIFKTRLSHELVDAFRILHGSQYYSDNRNENIIAWLRDINLNVKEKVLAYETAHFKSYGKVSPYIENLKDQFIKGCATITSLNDLFN